jgi:peptidyl-prolyl cis-trans isomerase A (cyclophilin A)
MKTNALLLLALFVLAACRSGPPRESTVDDPEFFPDRPVKEVTKVRFETTEGSFVVEVHPEWAPRGAERFLRLVKERYYDGAAFFHVVPGFVVQFGIAADPSVTSRWEDETIPDDPVVKSNTRGMVTFATAGPDTRTTQIFINYGDNSNLDPRGFAPFGVVVSGMQIVDRISSVHGESPVQDMISRRGNAYLTEQFPELDYIRNARIVK